MSSCKTSGRAVGGLKQRELNGVSLKNTVVGSPNLSGDAGLSDSIGNVELAKRAFKSSNRLSAD
jgi:hypothetical protein